MYILKQTFFATETFPENTQTYERETLKEIKELARLMKDNAKNFNPDTFKILCPISRLSQYLVSMNYYETRTQKVSIENTSPKDFYAANSPDGFPTRYSFICGAVYKKQNAKYWVEMYHEGYFQVRYGLINSGFIEWKSFETMTEAKKKFNKFLKLK